MNMKEINEIRSQIGQLEAKTRDARKRLEVACLRSIGLKVGDRIKAKGGIVEVTGCQSTSWGIARPVGLRVKKDGTTGSQGAGYITQWEKAE